MRVGIAGYGVVGKRRDQFIRAHAHLKTVAVCDQTFEGTGTFDDGVAYCRHYTDLLQAPLDVLFVCLTNDIAAEVTIAGMQAGLHVFCEKPPGRDLEDIVAVIEEERRHPGLKLKYGFNHRYHESVRDALALAQSGEMGELVNLSGVYGKSAIINFQSDWRTKRAIAGGGILLDQGIHMVDLLRLFAGDFTEVRSVVDNRFWRHDVEDNAYALMRTDQGVVAMLHSSATLWRHTFNLSMTYQNGTITLSGILSGSKSYGAERLTRAYRCEDASGDPNEETVYYENDPSWPDEIAEFTAAILNDEPIKNGSSAEAFKTMQLVYRIYCADDEWRQRWNISERHLFD